MIIMKRILILILALLMLTGCTAPIGTVQGSEWDVITIDGVEYVKADGEHDIYSSSDKDTHLGYIESGDNKLNIYSIKGDTEGNYLYIRWEWEGDIYVRKDLVKE